MDTIELSQYEDTDIAKSFEKSTAGKIPLRRTVVHPKTGVPFQRTYWVKPKDMAAFKSTEAAATFLKETVDAHQYFTNILGTLSKSNESLAAEVFQKMQETKQNVITLADSIVTTAAWTGRRETNLSDFLAAAKMQIEEKGKQAFSWADMEKLYADISYKYDNSGLAITKEGAKPINVKVSSVMNPENWAEKVGGVAKAVKESIARATERVRTVLGLRSKIAEKQADEHPAQAMVGTGEKVKPVSKHAVDKNKVSKKSVEVTMGSGGDFNDMMKKTKMAINYTGAKQIVKDIKGMGYVKNVVSQQKGSKLKLDKIVRTILGDKANFEVVGKNGYKASETADRTLVTVGYMTIDGAKYPVIISRNKTYTGISSTPEIIDRYLA